MMRETVDIGELAVKVGNVDLTLREHLAVCARANDQLSRRVWAVCLIILGAMGSIMVYWSTQGQAIQQAQTSAQTASIIAAINARK
jgi:hypothetical protein